MARSGVANHLLSDSVRYTSALMGVGDGAVVAQCLEQRQAHASVLASG